MELFLELDQEIPERIKKYNSITRGWTGKLLWDLLKRRGRWQWGRDSSLLPIFHGLKRRIVFFVFRVFGSSPYPPSRPPKFLSSSVGSDKKERENKVFKISFFQFLIRNWGKKILQRASYTEGSRKGKASFPFPIFLTQPPLFFNTLFDLAYFSHDVIRPRFQ